MKRLWHLAICEVRTGVANSCQRIGAAIRLHNFIINSEQLPYSSLEPVDMYVN